MKKRLICLLAAALTVASAGLTYAQFSDVPAGHWAKEAVEALAARGILTGYPDGAYRGDQPITRYEAAVILHRLLQAIAQEFQSLGRSPTLEALAPEELEAVKAAIQELAAEITALKVAVSVLADAYATKADLVELERALAALRARIEPGMDPEALERALEEASRARAAGETALALAGELAQDLDRLRGNLEDLRGLLTAHQGALEARGEHLEALNQVVVLLNQDLILFKDRLTALEKESSEARGRLATLSAALPELASKSELEAVRKSAENLSAKLEAHERRFAALESRVAELAATRYSLSGELSVRYGFATLSGADFDVDRLFPNLASTGVMGPAGMQEAPVSLEDLATRQEGEGEVAATFAVKNHSQAGGAFSLREASLRLSASVMDPASPSFSLTPDRFFVAGTAGEVAFSLTYSHRRSAFKFNDYLFVNASDPGDRETRQGVVLELEGKNLPLAPGATLVVGRSSTLDPGGLLGPTGYLGLRLTLSPALGTRVGLSYALSDLETSPGNGPDRSAVALDGAAALGDFTVKGVFVASRGAGLVGSGFESFFDPTQADWAYYLEAQGELGGVRLEANYHAVDPDYLGGEAGMSADHAPYYGGLTGRVNPAPYPNPKDPDDQEGLGLRVLAPLGPFQLEAKIDSNGSYRNAAGIVTTDLTATLSLPLSPALEVAGQYRGGWSGPSLLSFRAQSVSALSLRLTHNGGVAGSPLPGLDLTVVGTYDLRASTFGLEGHFNTSLNLGPLNLEALQGRVGNPDLSSGTWAWKVAARASLAYEPLRVFGEGGYRRAGNTTEFKAAGGLRYVDLLFPGMSLEARYGLYRAENVASLSVGGVDGLFDPTRDAIYAEAGGVSGELSGYALRLSFQGLGLEYGQYSASTGAQGRTFFLTYSVGF